mmetsp:Transcript_10162/g.22367  ORF Transcript_10162/g.22367 Transcript_10162/m.22367 type:complete len:224 (-) Transcript_10162:99-770(-)
MFGRSCQNGESFRRKYNSLKGLFRVALLAIAQTAAAATTTTATTATMKDISYSSLSLVLQTWDDARFKNKTFADDFGRHCVSKMFELNPNSKTFFGYEEGEDIALENSAMHGRLFSAVFDSIFQTLGPDQEFVEEVIQTVGRKHRVMGICPTYFDAMGEACVHTVSLLLERDMTEEEIEAWVEVYGALSTEMKKVIGETKLTEELAEQVNQQGRVMSLLETQS